MRIIFILYNTIINYHNLRMFLYTVKAIPIHLRKTCTHIENQNSYCKTHKYSKKHPYPYKDRRI